MRNKMRFDRKTVVSKDIALYFFNRIKCRIILDMHRLSITEFYNLWNHESICSLDFDNIIMNDKFLRTN